MPENDENTAKELFLRYGGSFFGMDHDGVYDQYKACGISRDSEIKWAKEHEENLLAHFCRTRLADMELCCLTNLITNLQDYDMLQRFRSAIIENMGAMDTFTKIRLSEDLIDIASELGKTEHPVNSVLASAKKSAMDLLLLARDEPLSVDPYYNSGQGFDNTFKPETLRRRILERISKLGKG